jgi:hypothetical protein
VSTTTPAPALTAYALGLGDDALILGQRLAEWITRALQIEEDVAIGNIALDLFGQARTLLTYAGEAEGAGLDEDDLAYMRDDRDFRNVHLVEIPNGDFAVTMARLLAFSAYQYELYQALLDSADATLAGLAGKAVKEVTYHRDHATQWVLRLGAVDLQVLRGTLRLVQGDLMTDTATASTRRHHAVFHELRVASVERLTDDAVAVTFDVPAELREEFRFRPGQHLSVRSPVLGDEVRRNYSICAPATSAPVTTRSPHATPSFAGTPRRQDPVTALIGNGVHLVAVAWQRRGHAIDIRSACGAERKPKTIEPNEPGSCRRQRLVALAVGSCPLRGPRVHVRASPPW